VDSPICYFEQNKSTLFIFHKGIINIECSADVTIIFQVLQHFCWCPNIIFTIFYVLYDTAYFTLVNLTIDFPSWLKSWTLFPLFWKQHEQTCWSKNKKLVLTEGKRPTIADKEIKFSNFPIFDNKRKQSVGQQLLNIRKFLRKNINVRLEVSRHNLYKTYICHWLFFCQTKKKR